MKGLASAYVNLLKTSIGSGVLNFPYLFKTYGLTSTILLTSATGLFAATGLYLLILCSQELGRSADLGKLAELSIPWASALVDLSVFMKCFGVATSYMIIAGSLLPSVINTLFDIKVFKPLCLLFFVSCIAPFCYLKKMDALKYSSFVGLISIIFVIIASIFRFKHDGTVADANINLFSTVPSILWLHGLGKFVFSFTCHQNIFYIFAELENNSLKRMKKLIIITATSAFILYMSFGISNYMMYGETVKDNVLMNYPEDYLTTLVHFLYVIVMGVSYPLQLSPGKSYLINLIRRIFSWDKESKKIDEFVNNFVMTLLILLTYFIAVSGVGLGIIFALVGATASTFMSMILPAVYYLYSDVEKTLFLTIVSYISFLFGIFVFFATLISLALKK